MLEPFLSSVRRTVLPNGLTLLTREKRGSGVVAIVTWVKAGYFHEPDEVAGMAHLFEHMFFKGSDKFPGPEEIARHVSALGGTTNAGTIYDSTHYYFVLPKQGFQQGLEIQADALIHPLFDPAELQKECEVVIEESNRKLDDPVAVAIERMFAAAFTEHRMRRWRIGSNDVLRNIRRENLVAFFETLYRPENIIVSVAGDVSHDEAIAQATATFGQLPRGQLRKGHGPAEPPQREFRFDSSTGDILQSYVVFGWHTVGEKHPDEEPLEVLAGILGSGRFSRLYRGVVDPAGASGASASHSVFEDAGIFTVRASLEDANLEEVQRRIMTEIENIKQFGAVEFELQLAKNREEAGLAFELEDVLGQAETLAFHESRGSYLDVQAGLELLRGVTLDDVQRVAREYLNVSNLTVYHYRPSGVIEAARDEILSLISGVTAASTPEDLPLPRVESAVRPAAADGTQRFVMSNGIVLFVRESPGTANVSTAIHFRGGRLQENSSNGGITQLMARSMRRGTSSRSEEQIDREIEFLGSGIAIGVDEDTFSFGFDILSRQYEPALAILADILLNPTFPSERVDEEKHLQLASIRRSRDSSGQRPFQLFNELFYGNHPYALPRAGHESSLENISVEDLRSWFELNVVADGALMVVAGDVSADDVRRAAESLLGGMRKSVALRKAVPPFRPSSVIREVAELRERKQTAIVIGFPTVPPKHPDWIPLCLLQDVTSGLAGTFFAELRGKRSLAYTVFAGDASHDLTGAFIAYIATEAGKEVEARSALLEEIRKLPTDGFTDEDVARAKSYLAGVMKIRLQTNGALAAEIAQNYLFGLGLDYTERFLERIAATTPEELREIAKKYFTRDNYTVAILRGKG